MSPDRRIEKAAFHRKKGKSMFINVTCSVLPPKEEYMEEIASLWDSRWLTNMGEKHQTLERMLQGYFGRPI